jgi:hypothetical protein
MVCVVHFHLYLEVIRSFEGPKIKRSFFNGGRRQIQKETNKIYIFTTDTESLPNA